MRVAFLGNFEPPHSSENHHAYSLETLGVSVDRLQEGKTTGSKILRSSRHADMFVWVHTTGLQPATTAGDVNHAILALQIPRVAYHLDLWTGLKRRSDVDDNPFFNYLDHFFTPDSTLANILNEKGRTKGHHLLQGRRKGHYLLPGVWDQECVVYAPVAPFDVAFVGNRRYHPEWGYRVELLDFLSSTYGDRFRHYGDGAGGHVRGAALNQVYADARVVVGDSLCLGSSPGYVSDRLFETVGRGGFLVMPRLPGVDVFQEGEHLVGYDLGDFAGLRGIINDYLDMPEERERIRHAGSKFVKYHHTYVHRWREIIEVVLGISL